MDTIQEIQRAASRPGRKYRENRIRCKAEYADLEKRIAEHQRRVEFEQRMAFVLSGKGGRR